MPINILPSNRNRESSGDLLRGGLSDLTGGFGNLAQNYAQMKQEQRAAKAKQEEQQRKAKYAQELESHKFGLQEQSDERKQKEEQRKSMLFAQLSSGVPINNILREQQPVESRNNSGPNEIREQNPNQYQQNKENGPSRDELLRMAAESGFNRHDISELEKSISSREKFEEDKIQHKESNRLKEESNRIREEAPERKFFLEDVRDLTNKTKTAKNIKKDLELLIPLAESGKLRSGKSRQLLDKIGLGSFWQQPISDVAEKIIGDLNLQTMAESSSAGSATASMLQQIAKVNPSLLASDQGIALTAKLKILNQEKTIAIGDELDKLRKEYRGKKLPNWAIEEAEERASSRIEQIDEEQRKLVESIAGQDKNFNFEDSNNEQETQQQNGSIQNNEESLSGAALRNATNAGIKGLSGFAGVPGNIIEGVKGIRNKINEASEGLLPEEFKGQKIQPTLADEIINSAGEYLSEVPKTISRTAENVLPEGYLKPKNEYEKVASEVSEDLGSLLFPLGGATKVSKALKIAGASNLAKFFAKSIGLGETAGEAVKIGTMIATSLKMQPSLKQKAAEYYKEAERLMPEGVVKVPSIDAALNKVKEFSQSGLTDVDSKQAINKVISGIEGIVGSGRAKIKDVLAVKQDLGEVISKAKQYPRAEPHLIKIREGLDKALKSNPNVPKEFSQALSKADSIYKGIKDSEKAISFIEDSPDIAKKIGSNVLNLIGLVLNPIQSTKTIASKVGAYQAGYALKNLFTNQTIAKEYAGMMKAALKESSTGVIKHGLKLNEAIEKENKKHSK